MGQIVQLEASKLSVFHAIPKELSANLPPESVGLALLLYEDRAANDLFDQIFFPHAQAEDFFFSLDPVAGTCGLGFLIHFPEPTPVAFENMYVFVHESQSRPRTDFGSRLTMADVAYLVIQGRHHPRTLATLARHFTKHGSLPIFLGQDNGKLPHPIYAEWCVQSKNRVLDLGQEMVKRLKVVADQIP